MTSFDRPRSTRTRVSKKNDHDYPAAMAASALAGLPCLLPWYLVSISVRAGMN